MKETTVKAEDDQPIVQKIEKEDKTSEYGFHTE